MFENVLLQMPPDGEPFNTTISEPVGLVMFAHMLERFKPVESIFEVGISIVMLIVSFGFALDVPVDVDIACWFVKLIFTSKVVVFSTYMPFGFVRFSFIV